jgi:hypothetical protein
MIERSAKVPIVVKPGERYAMTDRFGALTLTEHVTVVELDDNGAWVRIDAVDVSFEQDELVWLGSVHQNRLRPESETS